MRRDGRRQPDEAHPSLSAFSARTAYVQAFTATHGSSSESLRARVSEADELLIAAGCGDLPKGTTTEGGHLLGGAVPRSEVADLEGEDHGRPERGRDEQRPPPPEAPGEEAPGPAGGAPGAPRQPEEGRPQPSGSDDAGEERPPARRSE